MAENVNLFLDDIFNEKAPASPNKVVLSVPIWNGESTKRVTVCGLLASEPNINTGNKWGPILENYASISEFSSLLGLQSMFAWIGASTMCWKGTNPLSLNLDFYLINYRPNLNLEEKLKALTKLTALAEIKTGNLANKVTVAVHGGYSANKILADNQNQFIENQQYVENQRMDDSLGDFFENLGVLFTNPDFQPGLVTVQLGNKVSIGNLLVTRVDSIPSMVEVENGKALFYRVNVSLQGSRPLLTTDVDNMYK